MIRGIYTSANGMKQQKLMHEILADNLSNSNTTGYKSYGLIHKAHADKSVFNGSTEVGKVSYGSEAMDTKFNFEQGALRETGNPLDFGVSGSGFLPVQHQDGSVAYTRNGHFTLNAEGFIVNQQGDLLLDSGLSPVFIGIQGVNSVTVLRNGELQVNGEYNTQLAAFDFPKNTPMIKKESDQFIAAGPGANMLQNTKTTLQQGFIELSNVSSIKSSAEMVQIMRNYETNEKAMKMQMDTVGMLMHLTDGI